MSSNNGLIPEIIGQLLFTSPPLTISKSEIDLLKRAIAHEDVETGEQFDALRARRMDARRGSNIRSDVLSADTSFVHQHGRGGERRRLVLARERDGANGGGREVSR